MLQPCQAQPGPACPHAGHSPKGRNSLAPQGAGRAGEAGLTSEGRAGAGRRLWPGHCQAPHISPVRHPKVVTCYTAVGAQEGLSRELRTPTSMAPVSSPSSQREWGATSFLPASKLVLPLTPPIAGGAHGDLKRPGERTPEVPDAAQRGRKGPSLRSPPLNPRTRELRDAPAGPWAGTPENRTSWGWGPLSATRQYLAGSWGSRPG